MTTSPANPARVLIIDIPANGHLFPKLALVTELAARGHHITYVTVDAFAPKVRAAGASSVLTYPTTDPLASLGPGSPVTVTEALFRENVAILRAVEAYYGDDRPDLIAYDEVAFQAGRILRATWRTPAVQLCPSLVANEHYSYIGRVLELSPGFELTDPVEEIAVFLARYGLADRVEEFRWTLRAPDEPTVVFLPRALQPAGETFDDRFAFVGPSLSERDFLGDWQPPADRLPVVLVSLGTTYNQNPRFFGTAIEAFRGQPLHAVVSVGDGGFDPAALGPLPPNVEVHRWVPHTKVLAHAAAFVTHGGAGSLAEAFHHGVPVVQVPTAPDVLPYAERIRQLGVGVVLLPEDLDADRLRQAVLTVTGDQDIARRSRELRDHTRASGGAARAADVIENRLTPQPAS